MIKLKNILLEAEEKKKKGPYVQKPKPREPETSKELPGYQVTGREEDPITGTSTTYLEPEPKLVKYTREIARMKKTLRYYYNLPRTAENIDIMKEVASIVASLNNAEGKMRDLQNKINAFKDFGEK